MPVRRPLILPLAALALLVALGLLAGPAAAHAAERLFWAPRTPALEEPTAAALRLHPGLGGTIVAAEGDVAERLQAGGATPLELRPDETLWVVLLRDAGTAEFAPGVRVLVRAGHEAIVATAGETPELTPAGEAQQPGLHQTVRVPGMEEMRAVPPRPRTTGGELEPAGDLRALAPAAPDPLVQPMVDALTQAQYVATWQALDDFENRHTFAPQHEAATQWVLDRFLAAGLRAEFHTYPQSGMTRRNVMATLPGELDSTQVVYLIAHMDATSESTAVCAPGADDNASGTAAVIEAARVLAGRRFARTIKFVAFNGEEQGLVGSAHFARQRAEAGENIVGVYNLDMIAYRGSDPAPADFVIYTDAASQGLATTLADAASTYLPGLLEPVVRAEALGASDHASFWRYGYPAVIGCEAQAWGSDFCPWYHSCEDRIEKYPQDYPTWCAKAALAAVAITAGPLDLSGVFLAAGPVAAEDDSLGGTAGNADGQPGAGETVDLAVTLRNLGAAGASGIAGALRSAGGDAVVLDSLSSWSDLAPGAQGANLSRLRIQVGAGAADGQALPFELALSTSAGPRLVPFTLRVAGPQLSHRRHRVVDAATGNGNGVPDPGEALEIEVVLANAGAAAAAVSAVPASAAPHLTLLSDQPLTGVVPARGEAPLAQTLRVAVAPEALPGEDLPLDLAVTTDLGYATTLHLVLRVGTFFHDEMEGDAGWRLADPDDDAAAGRWARVEPLGTFVSGQPAQPELDHTPGAGTHCFVTEQGLPGGAAGSADVDFGKTTLTSPVFDLSGVMNPRVSYWRWYTNALGSAPGTDFWVVQVSADGGATWVDLERTSASAASWQLRTFALGSYVTPGAQMRFRFIAADFGTGSLVEAAVDDFSIEGDVTPVAVGEGAPAGALRFEPPRPNPAPGRATLAFTLPAAGRAALRVYAVDGSLVRTVADRALPAGAHALVWEGDDDAGRPAAPGVYFCRLQAAGGEIVRRITLLR